MRRAKKEGRWMATAPVGYSNKVIEDNTKQIVFHSTYAPILKRVFNELAAGKFNTEQI